MKRVLLFVGIGALAVVGAAVYFVLSRLDTLVADAIEHYGTEIAGVPVHVGSVSIALRDGRGTIRGLRVGNPPGFSSGDAFRLDEITLAIDPASVTATPLVIDELRINAPEARFEVDAKGTSNLAAIRKNIERYSAASPQKQGGESPRSDAELRIRIRRLEFRDGRVDADVSALDRKIEPTQIAMPGLNMENLGGARGGTPAEVGKAVLGAYTAAVARSVAASEAQREIEKHVGGEAGRAAGKLLHGILD